MAAAEKRDSSFDGLESATVEINDNDRYQTETNRQSTVNDGTFTEGQGYGYGYGNGGRDSTTRNNDYDDVVNFNK